MRPENQERLAGMTRNLEQLREQAAEMRTKLRDARFTAMSQDRMAKVTVTAGGQLAEVRINPKAMSGNLTDSEQLGASIVEAANAATAKAVKEMNEQFKPMLGDSFDARSVLRGEGDFDDMIRGARDKMR